jgi:hypothetical protein
VPSVVEAEQPRPGDGAVQPIGLLRADEHVAARAHHERRQPLEQVQPVARVVPQDGPELPATARGRRRRAVVLAQHVEQPGGVGLVRRREQQVAVRLEPAVSPGQRDARHVPRATAGGQRAGGAAGRGGDERQAPHPVAVPQRHLLGDHPAHRHAGDVRVLPPQVIQERDRVVRHVRHGERRFGDVATAAAAVVEPHDPVTLDERVPLEPPRLTGDREPHEQQHRGPPGAVGLVVEANAIHDRVGHPPPANPQGVRCTTRAACREGTRGRSAGASTEPRILERDVLRHGARGRHTDPWHPHGCCPGRRHYMNYRDAA